MLPDRAQLRQSIRDVSGIDIGEHPSIRAVAGGDINASYRVECAGQNYFLKLNAVSALPIFEAEADGLRAMSEIDEIRVPGVVAIGECADRCFLLLEWMDLVPGDNSAEERLGRGLAALHRVSSDSFGWPADNFIGSTPQYNECCDKWIAFYGDRRLAPQLEMADAAGHGSKLHDLGQNLIEALPRILSGHDPAVSLTHGDLWGGNRAWLANGTPVLFDPAICYADRETDLAMTRLFGGFGASFYHAYDEAWPLPEGHQRRVDLYQLYHLLNHLNLFGSGYLGRCIDIMENLLRGDRA